MHLVVVSTYPPRRCGLATFTADLRLALRESVPHWRIDVCAIDRDGLSYPPEVSHVLFQDRRDDYRRAAQAVAAAQPDLVIIQHEYGIFGGSEGDHVRTLAAELRALGVPYAVTLHTVFATPNDMQRSILAEVCRHAARITCFTDTARRTAAQAGLADPQRIEVVPHGVPTVLSQPTIEAKLGPALADTLAQLSDARVLSTFGLLRRGKGMEVAIEALPAIVARHPDIHYVIAGATHPETLRTRGESYRHDLVTLARRLGVQAHVWFVDAFLTEPELAVLLQRTEVYLTPYRTTGQTCSGALTFALAAGCPVVSTAYPYALDLLTPPDDPSRGALVPFDDPAAFASATIQLLDDRPRLAAARDSATALGAALTWPAVGARFATVLTDALPRHHVPRRRLLRRARLRQLASEARDLPAPAAGTAGASAEIGT